MVNLSIHHNELPYVLEQLIFMLELSSEAVYHLRKYMDDESNSIERHEASMAINYLLDYGFDTIKDIDYVLLSPPINLNLPKKAR